MIDRNGRIAYKHIGPLTPDVLQRKIMPLISELGKAESSRDLSQ